MIGNARGRVAILLLRCYPPAWRDRYGDELLALLADTSLTPRIAVDVAAGGFRQRARVARLAVNGGMTMTIGPAWRHPTAFALLAAVLLLPTFVFVAGSLLAYQFDVLPARITLEPMLDAIAGWRAMDLYLVMAPFLAGIAAVAPLVRIGLDRRAGGVEAVLSVRALSLNLLIALLAVMLGGLLVWHILAEAILQTGG